MPPRDVQIARSITLASSVQDLWPLLSDTDRTNRMLGLPAVEQIDPDENLSRTARGHLMGVPVQWHEQPFEWVFEQWFRSIRVFDPPLPVAELHTLTTLRAQANGGTRVEVQLMIRARNQIGRLGGALFFGKLMMDRLERLYHIFDSMVQRNQTLLTPPQTPSVSGDRLGQGLRRLGQFPVRPQLLTLLERQLTQADDADVLRMRPFALADAWGEPRLEVLRAFLYATRAGLLDLEWDVMCPSCRGPSVRGQSLADLASEAHCPSCNIRYDVNFDEAVELRFSVNPAIRKALDTPFCVGGPANTRHIVAQVWVPAGQTRTLQLTMPAGSYHLRSRQLTGRTVLKVDPYAQTETAHFLLTQTAIEGGLEWVRPGPVTLTLENQSGQPALIHLEQSAWTAQAASAALVTTMAEFRQLFASEVLSPGIGLAVRNMTLLFSDLLGSTKIYDTIGDALAYARVRDHFDAMRAAIERNNGALVKTIGDAVMAAFSSAEDAVKASFEIQHEFIAGEIAQGRPALQVKLGLHRGPCIAVNANNLLDYFGSTVNIAARVQSESVGGDIVVTPDVYSDPGVQQIVAQEQARIDSFERTLKGVSQGFTLYRLWPQEAVQAELAEQRLTVNG
jgi:class 3 adenylate cyclase